MRLTLEAFGRTLTLTAEKNTPTERDYDEHDNTAATVEVANGWRDEYAADCFGFGSQR